MIGKIGNQVGSVSSVMCLEKVKSMFVPLSVIELLTSDKYSRLYVRYVCTYGISTRTATYQGFSTRSRINIQILKCNNFHF